jgi:hypothetical protein
VEHGTFIVLPQADNKVCSWHTHDPGKLTCQNQNWRYCSPLSLISRVLFTLNSFHKARQSTELIMWKYWSSYMNLWIEKGLNFGQWLNSALCQWSNSCGTLSSSFCPKNWYPPSSPDLVLNDFWLFSKIKAALKGQKFQDIEDIQKMWWHWKLFHNRGFKNVPTMTASLGLVLSCSRGALQRWPLSVGCKYIVTLAVKSFREPHSYTLSTKTV